MQQQEAGWGLAWMMFGGGDKKMGDGGCGVG